MPYMFNFDWFSGNIPVFEKHLSPLAGQACAMLEIGTHEGRSATWLLDNILTHPDARLTCVDIHQQDNLMANLEATGQRGKVDLILGKSGDVLMNQPRESFDFIYVDGSHWSCDVLEDAVLAFRAAKVGAIIGFDDYLWDDPQYNQHGTPKPAIDAFVACYTHKLEILEDGFQLWVRKTGA